MNNRRLTQKRNKNLQIEKKRFRPFKYAFSFISIIFSHWGVMLYKNGNYVWYEINPPLFLVAIGVICAIVGFVINVQFKKLEFYLRGYIPLFGLLMVLAPFFKIIYNTIKFPGLYSYFLVFFIQLLIGSYMENRKLRFETQT